MIIDHVTWSGRGNVIDERVLSCGVVSASQIRISTVSFKVSDIFLNSVLVRAKPDAFCICDSAQKTSFAAFRIYMSDFHPSGSHWDDVFLWIR